MIKEIVIGSDHAGFPLKEKIIGYLHKQGLKLKDVGTYTTESCDYPDFAAKVASDIASHKNKRGILICKTGIGNSITANRFKGVRAALCYNVKAAQLSRQHNDSNILVLGKAFVPFKLAKKIIAVWLSTDFEGGRHARRLNKIKKIEKTLGSKKK